MSEQECVDGDGAAGIKTSISYIVCVFVFAQRTFHDPQAAEARLRRGAAPPPRLLRRHAHGRAAEPPVQRRDAGEFWGECRTGLRDAMPCGRSRSIDGDGLIAAHSHYIQNQVSKTLSADTSYFLRNFAQVSTAKRMTRKVLFESSIATGSRLTEVLSESSIATGSRHPTLPRPFTQSTDTRAPARWA